MGLIFFVSAAFSLSIRFIKHRFNLWQIKERAESNIAGDFRVTEQGGYIPRLVFTAEGPVVLNPDLQSRSMVKVENVPASSEITDDEHMASLFAGMTTRIARGSQRVDLRPDSAQTNAMHNSFRERIQTGQLPESLEILSEEQIKLIEGKANSETK